MSLELSEKHQQKMEELSISEDEVSDCISEKVDNGMDREQAIAICLSEAEEGSSEPDQVNGEKFLQLLFDDKNIVKQVEDIDTTPTQEMADIASEALEKIEDSDLDNDDCGTRTGLERANQLENREELSADTVGRMVSFFARHDGNQEVETENKWEDCGFVAWQLWGGDPGRDWAERKLEEIEDAREDSDKSLENPEFDVGDFVRWDFSTGSAEGEIIERSTEVGDSMSAGGNEFTIEDEDDEPLYKIEEFDDEDQEFTNNVVKFEGELREVERPEAAERSIDEINTMSSETIQDQKNSLEENREEMKTAQLEVTGKDVEVKETNSDGEIVVNIPVQAISEDRDGDIITEKGQESIVRQLKSGTVPLVLNHGIGSNDAMYDFRDIVGQFVDGENRNGTTIGTARMRRQGKESDELHEDAKEVVDLLEQDMPIGFSVGFIPQQFDEKENGGMEISDLDLMEVSAVGIPSNPDAVPQAMGSAVAMAKNAGFSKDEIMSNIKQAFNKENDGNDTMTEQTKNEDGQEQNNDESKSEEKQLTSEDVELMMEMVGETVSSHIQMAMDEAEDELMEMIDEDNEEEEDEMDEDEDEEETDGDYSDDDEEEMSQDDASDHSEDSEKDESSESADNKSETEEKEGLTEDEKTLDEEESAGKTINEVDEGKDESENENLDEDPNKAQQPADYWA